MTTSEDVTLGEVSRQLAVMRSEQHAARQEYTERLNEIRDRVVETSSDVKVHSEQIRTQGREIGELKESRSNIVKAIWGLVSGVVVGLVVFWATRQ